MANTILKTRIVLNNKTTDEWLLNKDLVGLRGEFLVDTVTRKIKIGDGATTYEDLPYVTLTPEEISNSIKESSHKHNNKDILDATSASFTTELLEKIDSVESGANKTIVDDKLSSTSMNPVQNKVLNSALNNKVSTSEKGVKNGVTPLDASGKIASSYLPDVLDCGSSNI